VLEFLQLYELKKVIEPKKNLFLMKILPELKEEDKESLRLCNCMTIATPST